MHAEKLMGRPMLHLYQARELFRCQNHSPASHACSINPPLSKPELRFEKSPPIGELTLQALTAPFHFVVVPKSNLKPEFVDARPTEEARLPTAVRRPGDSRRPSAQR